MKIVIDIQDDVYRVLKDDMYPIPDTERLALVFKTLVKKGTPLPKGHGDLKDMNDLCYKSRYGCKGNCDYLHICNLYGASTVIEADKEEKA